MLNIQNYTKRFGDKIAVDDLSLHIAAGEICAFIGHKARMEALAERLDIKNALPNLISECSHGMKQKIAVIGALIHEPKLILMDEPFVGLDPIAAHELKEIMAEHCRNGGAIFFSTHVLEVAEKLCDNVAIIKNGKLIAHGTMDSVRGDGSLEQVFLELEDHKD